MANPELDAVLPWQKAGDESIAWALRELHAGKVNITAMTLVVPYIHDLDSVAWKQLEDRTYRLLPRPLLRGCDDQIDIIQNIYRCLRTALSSKDYLYAMWILYLAEREHIPLVDQRYWRQLDQIVSTVPLGNETNDAIIFVSNAMGAKHQQSLINNYLQRLINEERWELVMRFFKIPLSGYYADALRIFPGWLIAEMLDFLPSGYLINYIRANLGS